MRPSIVIDTALHSYHIDCFTPSTSTSTGRASDKCLITVLLSSTDQTKELTIYDNYYFGNDDSRDFNMCNIYHSVCLLLQLYL